MKARRDQQKDLVITAIRPRQVASQNMPDTSDKSELQAKLKSSLWYHVGQMVDDATLDSGTNATTQFTGALTELVWAQLGTLRLLSGRYAADLW